MDLIGGIHDSLSLHVLTPFPVYTGQRGPPRVPHSKRSTKVCVFVDAADWTNEQRIDWIEDRLRTVVRQAYEQTEYYRELLDRIEFDVYADFSFKSFPEFRFCPAKTSTKQDQSF